MNALFPIAGVVALAVFLFKKSSDDANAAQDARLSAQDAALNSMKAEADARKKAEDDARIQAEAKAKQTADAEAAKKAAAEKKAGTDLESLKASVVFSANALNATNFVFQTVNPVITGKSIGLIVRALVDNDKATKADYYGWLSVLNSEFDGRMKAGGATATTAAINKLRSALYHYGVKFFGMG